jgi:cell division protein ZapA
MLENSRKFQRNSQAQTVSSPRAQGKPGAQGGALSPAKRSVAKTPDRKNDVNASGALSHDVEIAGVPLRLKSSHDHAVVKALVDMVDRQVKLSLPLTKTGSVQNAAILACLHFAEAYNELLKKTEAELGHLEQRALRVITELENS